MVPATARGSRFVGKLAELDDPAAARRTGESWRLVPRHGKLLQIGPGFFDARRVELLVAAERGEHQRVVAELVDQPRNAVGRRVNRPQGVVGEDSSGKPPARRICSCDVVDRFVAAHRLQIAAGGDPLVERFELRARQPLFQGHAAGQHQPHARLAALAPGSSAGESLPAAAAAACGLHRRAAAGRRRPPVRGSRWSISDSRSSLFVHLAIRQLQLEQDVLQQGPPRAEPGCWRAGPREIGRESAGPALATAATCRCRPGRRPGPALRRARSCGPASGGPAPAQRSAHSARPAARVQTGDATNER